MDRFQQSTMQSDGLTRVNGIQHNTKDDDDVVADPNANRESWGGKFEFVLTIVGFAVGLGNVWRFPYLAYQNGGGAFLIPFCIFIVIVGFPFFMLEVSVGQFCSRGTIQAWALSPIFKGVGFATIIVTTYIILYYNVIVTWCLYYFFASMTSVLPWSTCDNPWNSPGCITAKDNVSELYDANGTINGSEVFSASEEYFYHNVLQISDGIHNMGKINWKLAALLFVAWATVFLVLIKGVQSLGKVAYFVSLFPYFMLTVMLVWSCFLPGAAEGIKYYMLPDWQKLRDPNVWVQACSQVFFSCSCCQGGLYAMASFNKFNYNVQRDAFLIPIVVLFTSTYAGFVVFMVLGYLAHSKGVPVSEVAQGGPGLVFVAYPEGLVSMPGSVAWSILFFFMMSTLGFSSQFSLTEAVCTSILDEWPQTLRKGSRPKIVRGVICFTCFLLALPMTMEGGFYLFTIMDNYTAAYPLLIVGIMEMIGVNWVYGYAKFADDIEMMLGHKLNKFWKIMWMYISPIVIMLVLVVQCVQQTPLTLGEYVFPSGAMTVAWCIVAFPCAAILVWMLIDICRKGGWEATKRSTKETKDWGPVLPENRTGRYGTRDVELKLEDDTFMSELPIPEPKPDYDNMGYVSEALSHF